MGRDSQETAKRITDVLRRAGKHPWLVGYDINGIQELIAASSRPKIMHGASETIRKFDAAQAQSPLSIFAGGGRGYELVTSEDDAQKRVAQIPLDFRQATITGVVAAAAVPFDPKNHRMSRVWLDRKLDNAKDMAPRPGGMIPREKGEECEDCHALVAERNADDRADTRRTCARCNQFKDCVRDIRFRESLKEYGEARRLAVVSADGNNVGAFFRNLGSLQELAVASKAIAEIFVSAHLRAMGENKILAPITGGDDIRAFMAPSLVLGYVEKLVRGVEEGIQEKMGDVGAVLSAEARKSFSHIGIGIGVVVAGDHYPAARLLAHAHDLEKRAKTMCRGKDGVRSAFDFSILTSETTVGTQGMQGALSMEIAAWEKALHNARALKRNVPAAQRGLLVERFTSDSPEEFYNRFGYQVARSKKWQAWLDECRVEWYNPDKLREHLEKTRIDLIDLLPRGEQP